jgi:hypothetical protein
MEFSPWKTAILLTITLALFVLLASVLSATPIPKPRPQHPEDRCATHADITKNVTQHTTIETGSAMGERHFEGDDFVEFRDAVEALMGQLPVVLMKADSLTVIYKVDGAPGVVVVHYEEGCAFHTTMIPDNLYAGILDIIDGRAL